MVHERSLVADVVRSIVDQLAAEEDVQAVVQQLVDRTANAGPPTAVQTQMISIFTSVTRVINGPLFRR